MICIASLRVWIWILRIASRMAIASATITPAPIKMSQPETPKDRMIRISKSSKLSDSVPEWSRNTSKVSLFSIIPMVAAEKAIRIAAKICKQRYRFEIKQLVTELYKRSVHVLAYNCTNTWRKGQQARCCGRFCYFSFHSSSDLQV